MDPSHDTASQAPERERETRTTSSSATAAAPPKPPKKRTSATSEVSNNAPLASNAPAASGNSADEEEHEKEKEKNKEKESSEAALLANTKALAKRLRLKADESRKLATIKGSEELVTRLDEVLAEIDEQSDKVQRAMRASPSVVQDVRLLREAMLRIEEFFGTVDKAHFFTSKHKLKLTMQNHYQSLRARCTQLLTAVSLQLLAEKPVEAPRRPQLARELYERGVRYLHGLDGHVLNFSLALEQFLSAAEQDEPEAMLMTARCLLRGWGTPVKEREGWQWLEKAIRAGSAAAKTEFASLVLQEMKEKDKHVVKRFAQAWRESERGKERDRERDRERDSEDENEYDRRNKNKSNNNSSKQSRNNKNKSEYTYRDEDDHDEEEDEQAERARDEERERDALLQRALSLLAQAAAEHHVEAKTQLGLFYLEAGDAAQAAKWFSLASSAGCARATLSLAEMVLNGHGRLLKQYTEDERESKKETAQSRAYSLYGNAVRSADLGDAHNGLGLCCEHGIGTEVSIERALTHYRRGTQRGSAKAMYNLGYLLVKEAMEMIDELRAREREKRRKNKKLRNRSQQPHSDEEEFEEDEEYEGEQQNDDGEENDKKKDFFLITPEADSEGVPAERAFLVLYAANTDGESDELVREMRAKCESELREGVHWLRCAAENKIDDAAFQLARLYEQGIGVPIDRDAALANYLFAARYGHAKAACFAANILYERVAVYLQAWEKLVSLYRQAAKGGVPQAMNSYALLLEDGRAAKRGVRDVVAAAAWYYEACKHKYVKSFLNLGMLLASEDIPFFHTIRGERVTLAQAMRFLEDNLPKKTSAHDADEFSTLMAALVQRMQGSQSQNRETLPYDRKMSVNNMNVSMSKEFGTFEFTRDPAPRLRDSATIKPSSKPQPLRLSTGQRTRTNESPGSSPDVRASLREKERQQEYEQELPSRSHNQLSGYAHVSRRVEHSPGRSRRGEEDREEVNGLERERREDITRGWNNREKTKERDRNRDRERERERDKAKDRERERERSSDKMRRSESSPIWPQKSKDVDLDRASSNHYWAEFLRTQSLNARSSGVGIDNVAVSRDRPSLQRSNY